MDIQVLWQAGDHLAAPGQYFSLDFHRISLPLSHLQGELRKPRSSPGTACLGALKGWGGAAKHSKSREELSMGWKQNHVWGHVSFLSLHALPRSGVVQTVQTQGKVWFKHNLRLEISFRSTLGFFPTGCSGITFSHSPNTPNISVKTHKMMIKLDKAIRDWIINGWVKEDSKSLIFIFMLLHFLKSPWITYIHLTYEGWNCCHFTGTGDGIQQIVALGSVFTKYYNELIQTHMCVCHKGKLNRTFLSVSFSLLPCPSGPLTYF